MEQWLFHVLTITEDTFYTRMNTWNHFNKKSPSILSYYNPLILVKIIKIKGTPYLSDVENLYVNLALKLFHFVNYTKMYDNNNILKF